MTTTCSFRHPAEQQKTTGISDIHFPFLFIYVDKKRPAIAISTDKKKLINNQLLVEPCTLHSDSLTGKASTKSARAHNRWLSPHYSGCLCCYSQTRRISYITYFIPHTINLLKTLSYLTAISRFCSLKIPCFKKKRKEKSIDIYISFVMLVLARSCIDWPKAWRIYSCRRYKMKERRNGSAQQFYMMKKWLSSPSLHVLFLLLTFPCPCYVTLVLVREALVTSREQTINKQKLTVNLFVSFFKIKNSRQWLENEIF